MSDLPERAGQARDAIDVRGRESVPASQPLDADAPPSRQDLTTPELIEEGTRLVVGSVLLLGRGLRRMLETYAVAARDNDAGGGSLDGRETVVPAADPHNISSALPTALLGLGVIVQRRALEAAGDARERLGPALGWFLDQPLVSPAYLRVRRRVFEWYRVGADEGQISQDHALALIGGVSDEGLGFVYQNLDLNIITSGFDVSPLIENLQMNDIIVQSTGGLATEAIDAVRAQGVTADAIVDRIARKVFRRRGAPKGPPGTFGLQRNIELHEGDSRELPPERP